MKSLIALSLASFLSTSPLNATPKLPRRSFLQGLSLLTGGALSRRAPGAAPAVTHVAEASAPLRAARAERVHSLLTNASIFNVKSESSISHFSAHEIDVVRDWLAEAPGARDAVAQKLERMLAVNRICVENEILNSRDFGTEKWNRASEAYSEAAAERTRLRREITEAIDEWPWSSLSWPEVFSANVAEIENEVALELGRIDVGRVQQLTEHALTTSGDVVRPGAHLFAWLARADSVDTPLYSKRAIDVLVRKLEGRLPALAEKIEFLNAEANLDRDNVRMWLAKSSQFFKLEEHPNHPTDFVFDRFEYFVGRSYDPIAMAPWYARGIAHFERVHRGLERLGPSPLKTMALAEVVKLRAEMQDELRTLPMRLHWFNERYSQKPKGSANTAVPERWTDLPAHPALMLDPAALLRWMQTLEGLRATTPTVGSLAEECAARLSESSTAPLRIEARPDESLDLHELSERETVAK